MHFHHRIEVNQSQHDTTQALSRTQLWLGLVLRAQSPQLFMAHLDECTVTNREEFVLHRSLRYGELIVHDSVHFLPDSRVLYSVPQQGDIAASQLTMTIEEPEIGHLFLRFDYDDDKTAEQDEADAFYDEFRRSAYLAADQDTLDLIREFAVDGRFDRPLS
jgi:Domain of unknown function (DUF1857)